MMTPLEFITTADGLKTTEGAVRLMQTDPHGWVLTLVSVSVVFACLLVLCGIYTLSGNIFSGKYKRRGKAARKDEEVAAAIAMALDRELSGETEAAIAMALHLHLSESVHDTEPGIITIRRTGESPWADKSLTFRKKVRQ